MYDDNLGDPLMVYCVKRLLENIVIEENQSINFREIDLLARDKPDSECVKISKKNKLLVLIYKILKRIAWNDRVYQKYEIKRFNIENSNTYKNYFEAKIKKLDCLIIVGGALITYRYNRNFHSPLNELIIVADENNIPVYFNSVGIEKGYDNSYTSCNLIESFLTRDCVHSISTRDDLESLKKYVQSKEDSYITLTSDSAIFSKEIFEIRSEIKYRNIGIGIIAPDKFNQYDDVNRTDEYIEVIDQLINYLICHQIDFYFFTNRHIQDYKYAKYLIDKFNIDNPE